MSDNEEQPSGGIKFPEQIDDPKKFFKGAGELNHDNPDYLESLGRVEQHVKESAVVLFQGATHEMKLYIHLDGIKATGDCKRNGMGGFLGKSIRSAIEEVGVKGGTYNAHVSPTKITMTFLDAKKKKIATFEGEGKEESLTNAVGQSWTGVWELGDAESPLYTMRRK
ncbi:unnamed protein product [Peniophora sp. CBMAI 1063]|nr:unnamed protein product [Peniophora sp. CBMAI 1063]